MLTIAKVFLVHNGKVLLMRRAALDVYRPGDYDIPGGAIEEGEAVAVGVAREVYEETGQIIAPERLREIIDFGTVSNEPDKIKRVFAVRVDNDKVVLEPKEHSSYIWVEPWKAAQLFRHPFYGAGLQYAIDHDLL